VINAWWIQLCERVDPSDETREQFTRREYVHSAYIGQRASDYLERGVTCVDSNDFEDAGFCQHLSLDADVATVTADSALQTMSGTYLCVVEWPSRQVVSHETSLVRAGGIRAGLRGRGSGLNGPSVAGRHCFPLSLTEWSSFSTPFL
jgi:hypothetical protein